MEMDVVMLTFLVATSLLCVFLAALYIHSLHRSRKAASHFTAEQVALQQELSALQAKLQGNSYDPVTNLLGWQLFEDRLNQSVKESARYQFILGVMVVDIDSFKLINNAMGHVIGDGLLSQVAERLQSCVRQVDSITRQSKDKFVVLLAQLAKQETAAIIIQRMLHTMAQPFEVNGHKLSITVCIGASFFPDDALAANELIQNAEHALSLAKARGKNTYQFYQEQLLGDSQRELSLYNSLSSDAFLDELKLVYQPVMDVVSRRMCCADTQIIWQHAGLGEISSQELFGLAAQHRKLNKITEGVLAQACKKFLQWREQGAKPQMLGIPVLLKQLEHTQFIYRLSQIMQEMKVQPDWVMLEVKESNVPVSLDILEKSFNMLHYLGVKIAIDNFGSGSFSLRYLKSFSIDYLKLDPGLIGDIAHSEETQSLVKAMALFAGNLSIEVIATGVESDDQAKVLKDLGIVLMQGRFISAPLTEIEMAGNMTNA
jgi:diguanylate cyclase (GGDEF)-like protein